MQCGITAAGHRTAAAPRTIMFTPRGPRAWPSLGLGLAVPAAAAMTVMPFTAAMVCGGAVLVGVGSSVPGSGAVQGVGG